MSFVYPGFLFALLALSIPIVVHLFNFKRFKKVYFSDVRFLKDIELQTRQRNQLKHLLVLLSRLLAITFLVMAFAQPVIPTGNGVFNPNERSVSVYLDNSFSMDGEGENGDLLEHGKLMASQVAKAYANAGEIRFYTNRMNAAQGRGMTVGEFDEEVSQVAFSSSVRPLSQVIKRVTDRTEETASIKDVYVISDLQRSTTDLENLVADSADQINIIPISANAENNLFVDSLWFTSPIRQSELPDELKVRIRNIGDQRKEDIPVRLMLNGSQRSLANISIEPASYEVVSMSFRTTRPGFHFGEVIISDHPITYDDNYYFTYQLASEIRVLEVRQDGASKMVASLFGNDPGFSLQQMEADRINHSAFNNYDLIILNGLENVNSGLIQELLAVAETGSSVLMIPSVEATAETYNELLLATSGIQFKRIDTVKTKINNLNLNSNIFKNVFMDWKGRIDLPVVNKHFAATIPSKTSAEVIMQLEGGDPLLVRTTLGKGAMYVFTTSAKTDASQLASHAIVVPTLYNIALNSQSGIAPYQVLGRNDELSLMADVGNAEVLKIRSVNTEQVIIPELRRSQGGLRLNTYDQITEAGQYVVMNGQDTLQTVSFNFDRKESDVTAFTKDELQQKLSDLGLHNVRLFDGSRPDLSSSIKEMYEGKKLWKLFLILALVALAIEVLLLRIL